MLKLPLALVASALMLAQAGRTAPADAPPTPFLEHIGIYVANAVETARFFTDVLGLRFNTVSWAIAPDSKGSGGLKLSFVDGNGMQFTLIEPTSGGPAADDLAHLGNGALAELDFEVPDFDAEYDLHQRNGIRFVTMGGAPFPEGQKGWTVEPYGLRLIYLPQTVTHGITTELYQRGPAATDILEKRDRGWDALPPLQPDAPKLVRTIVLVQDLERSSAYVEKLLRLPKITHQRTSGGMSCARFDSGAGSQVELVRPPLAGPLADQLERMGDGYLAGLLYEVPSIEAAKDKFRSKDVRVLNSPEAGLQALTAGCLDGAPDANWAGIDPRDSTGLRIAMVSRSSLSQPK